jgi:sugar lactone lactonase YvrE
MDPKTTAPSNNISAAFIYNQLNGGQDLGIKIPWALGLLQSKGAATLADMPYIPGQYTTQPTAAAFANALHYRLSSWGTLAPNDMTSIKAQIAAGLPVVYGLKLYSNFKSLGPNQMYTTVSGQYVALHAFTAVGYNDSLQAIKIINSWGPYWGTNGYAWISYTAMNQIAVEAYSAIDDHGMPPKPTPPPAPSSLPFQGTVTTLSYSAFNNPYGITVDAVGNVYVSNQTAGAIGSSIWKLSAPFLFVPNSVTNSFYSMPAGLAVDQQGNTYVSDPIQQRISKITSAGVSTAFAGNGAGGMTGGYQDGAGNIAQFGQPNGLAVDSVGNLYVADTLNNRIRKITPAGVVTTLAGSGGSRYSGPTFNYWYPGSGGYMDGIGTVAQFKGPMGVAVDASGNVYVADTANNRIRKITPAGVVTTLAGSGTPGYKDAAGIAAQFNYPTGIAVDSGATVHDSPGNVYVADTYNNRIRKISPAGIVTTVAGSGIAGSTDGVGTGSQFDLPTSLAVDSTGNVFVADYKNKLVREIQ